MVLMEGANTAYRPCMDRLGKFALTVDSKELWLDVRSGMLPVVLAWTHLDNKIGKMSN